MLNYAVIAYRLLEMTGNYELSAKLPEELKVTGILRQMVFYYYQEKSDYAKALEYAERWLQLVPNDNRVKLFQARCYRNFRDAESLEKARKLVDELDSVQQKRQPRAELLREKAIIAASSNDEEAAIRYYRLGISIDMNYTYIENYTGLAMIYLRQAERLSEQSEERLKKAHDALELLEFAREQDRIEKRDSFDEFHLGIYVEALIENSKDEKAFPLIMSALKDKPEDASLLYRLAEIYRRRENYENAEKYAHQARKFGEPKAFTTLANIAHARALRTSDPKRRGEYIQSALQFLDAFIPNYGSGIEVRETLRAKMYRTINEYEKAINVLKGLDRKYHGPRLILELCIIWRDKAYFEESQADYIVAYNSVSEALKLCKNLINNYKQIDVQTLNSEIMELERKLKEYLRT